MFTKRSFFYLLFYLFLTSNQLIAQKWELEKDEEGIQIYTRIVAGSPVKEYKAITTLQSSTVALSQILRNQDELKGWFDLCYESKRLKKVSDNEYFFYLSNDAPWPVQDRDLVAHAIFEIKKDETQWITFTAVPDYLPEREERVRIPKMKAHWEFKKLPSGSIQVIQQAHVDLGGSIPAWIINAVIVDSPFKTMQNLKKKVKSSK